MMIDDPFEKIAETFDWIHTFRGDIPFWINQAKRNEGPVLELGCGTGRTTWKIADAGVPIVGLDLSMAMLRVAESKRTLHPNAASVILKLADMRDFNLGVKFNTIIMPGRSFEFVLTSEDQQKIFKQCDEHLHEGGNLVIFTMGSPNRDVPEGVEYLHKSVLNPNTGNTCRLYNNVKFDYENQITLLIQRLEEIEANGNTLREWNYPLQKLHWSNSDQMEQLGVEQKFKVVARFSDWLRRPYREGDHFMIYVYEK